MDHKQVPSQQSEDILQRTVNGILSRQLSDGGFAYTDMAAFHPEATAWAVLALRASGLHLDLAARACDQLVRVQQSDGRVSAVPGHDPAAWPTPLCILAWKCLQGYRHAIDAGIDFLLKYKGRHKAKAADSPVGHDTTIVGWPWVEETHSWIEPTCLSMLALKANGYNRHQRTAEAARMIMDRQLNGGGWNYGNTTVFDQNLLPIPENTGQALCALSGMTDIFAIQDSIKYLKLALGNIRTPLALSWMLLGLGMWSKLPLGWAGYIIESLDLQQRYGPFDTVQLSQLVTVFYTGARIIKILV